MLAYLLGGIALVLVVLYWLFPRPGLEHEPVAGWLEARYRAESSKLFSAAGISPSTKCEYVGKMLVLVCRVPLAAQSSLDSALRQAGWSFTAGESGAAQFVKERSLAIVRCPAPRRDSECEFTLNYK